MKELTDEVFFQEAYKFDVKRLYGFAMVSAFRTISPKRPYSEFNANERFSHKMMLSLFSGVSAGEELSFVNPANNNLYFVNPDVMLEFEGYAIDIIDNMGVEIGAFAANIDEKNFQIRSDNFTFTLNTENNPRKNELLFFVSNHEEESFITLQKNKLIIDSSNSDLTLIEIKKNTILTQFKNPIYSSILFDYNFNIKEIGFSKKLQKELGLDRKFKINDVNYEGGLINEIKTKIKNNLDFYKLINDDNYIIETPEISFESEIIYIKSIVSKHKEMLTFYEKNKEGISKIQKYYEKTMLEYSKTNFLINNAYCLTSNLVEDLDVGNTVLSQYIGSKTDLRNLKLLSFLVLKDKYMKNAIHPELLNIFKNLNSESLNLMPSYIPEKKNSIINKLG